MTEFYYKIMNTAILFMSEEFAMILGFLFLFMAMWFVFKRRQIGAGLFCFVMSALTSFGYTVFVYFRGQ